MQNLADIINRVHNADCLTFMRDMPDESVDMVLTDPPYNVGKHYLGGDYGHNDNMPEDDYWLWYAERFREVYQVMRDRTYLYVTSTSKQMFLIKPLLEELGFTWLQVLIWYGPNMVGGSTAFRMPWTQLYEPISLFAKGKRIRMFNVSVEANSHDVLIEARPQSNFSEGRYHICQKPLNLYKRIISRTPGQIILDPFAGSGTTGIAAKNLGRDFILVEISSNYCEMIQERLAQAVLPFTKPETQEPLFSEAES